MIISTREAFIGKRELPSQQKHHGWIKIDPSEHQDLIQDIASRLIKYDVSNFPDDYIRLYTNQSLGSLNGQKYGYTYFYHEGLDCAMRIEDSKVLQHIEQIQDKAEELIHSGRFKPIADTPNDGHVHRLKDFLNL